MAGAIFGGCRGPNGLCADWTSDQLELGAATTPAVGFKSGPGVLDGWSGGCGW